MTQKKLENILTKDFLVFCIKRDMSNKQIADYVKRDYNRNTCSVSTVHLYMKKFGLELKHRNSLDLGLDLSAIEPIILEKVQEDDRIGDLYQAKSFNPTVIENLIVMVSDTQIGALYDFNGFNSIPEENTYRYVSNFLKNFTIMMMHRNIKVNNIHLFFLGDMVDGELIYPSHASLNMTTQSSIAVKVMRRIVESMKLNCNDVYVHTVAGNHGRGGYNRPELTNWDIASYNVLEIVYENDNNVIFDDPKGYSGKGNEFLKTAKVGDWSFMYTHGHYLGKGMITRNKAISKFNNWNRTIGRADGMLLGHFHTTMYMNYNEAPILVNGTSYKSPFIRFKLGGLGSMRFMVAGVGTKRPLDWVDMIELTDDDENW